MKHTVRFGTLLLAGWVLSATGLAQTLYKSVTPDGRVLYSDQPPSSGKIVKTVEAAPASTTALPTSAAEQLRKLQAAKTALPATGGIVLYTASWCGYCKQAKAYLATKGIAYREIDIDTPDGLAAFAQAGGGKGVPLLVAGDQKVRGFSSEIYDGLFARNK